MARVNKVAHVVLSVRDVMTSVDFYTKALGLEVVDLKESHRAAFLSFGSQHHDIALFAAPEGAERGKVGLSHIAFQIEGGLPELAELKGRLEEMGASISRTTDHTITKSVLLPRPRRQRAGGLRGGVCGPQRRAGLHQARHEPAGAAGAGGSDGQLGRYVAYSVSMA